MNEIPISSEIIENLFVGNCTAGHDFSKNTDGVVIDVRDYCVDAPKMNSEYHYQCLFPEEDQFCHVVSIKNLDKIADLIEKKLKQGKRVIVNCGAGMERSPLTIAWYLYRKKGMGFRNAYQFVKDKHRATRDVECWLPFGYDE